MHVERAHLALHGINHMQICMTHAGHIVVHVQVLLAVGAIEPDTIAPYNVHRLPVEKWRRAEQALSSFKQFRHIST